MSPVKLFDLNSVELSPVKFNGPYNYYSPMKKNNRYNKGKIISPERGNPFAETSPDNKRTRDDIENNL